MSSPSRRSLAILVALALASVGAACGSDAEVSVESAAPADSPTDAGEPAAGGTEPVTDVTEPAAVPDTDPSPSPAAPATVLADGPVTLITLGDSLTAGDGDEAGVGYGGRLLEAIDAMPGRSGSSLVNLGASGWDSTMMVSGQDGTSGQLMAAVEAANAAVAAGQAVLATVLIGSNDLWYLYEYGAPEGTRPEDEDAAEALYRANLERTVSELQQAGAVVVIGLPDDQSLRPGAADLDRLHDYLPSITTEELAAMTAMAARLGQVTLEVAAASGVLTVDTNAPFWADPSKMADDGIHPNGDGYTDLAALWLPVIESLA